MPRLKPDELEQGTEEEYPADIEDRVDGTCHTPLDERCMNIHVTKAFHVNRYAGWAVTCWVALCLLTQPAWAQKSLRMEDVAYEPQIRTVLCYSLSPGTSPGVPAASAKLEAQNLVLEFDDLQEDKANYYLRLIHCNHDWTRSSLRDLDILREYNEFPINDYGFSINTHIPYVHYRIPIPPVKLPGNYLAIVYRDGDKNDIVLSRRFLVYQNLTFLMQEENLVGLGNLKSTNQALNFRVSYSRMEVLNPATSVHVHIRQNQRWDNARMDIRPSFIREDLKQLEYRFFDMDHSFSAGNEFRFVDFRSLNSPGINTDRIDRSRRPAELFVAMDASRNGQAYTQYPDKNGSFVIENLDSRPEPWLGSNYLHVNFTLRSPRLAEDVYVLGSFNGWRLEEENRMTWTDGTYRGRILLKQGFYDYQYWMKPTPTYAGNYLEGDHFQTENMYEVLVYYRPFQPNADLLIGYFLIPVNPR